MGQKEREGGERDNAPKDDYASQDKHLRALRKWVMSQGCSLALKSCLWLCWKITLPCTIHGWVVPLLDPRSRCASMHIDKGDVINHLLGGTFKALRIPLQYIYQLSNPVSSSIALFVFIHKSIWNYHRSLHGHAWGANSASKILFHFFFYFMISSG